jgi:hypothetical protein
VVKSEVFLDLGVGGRWKLKYLPPTFDFDKFETESSHFRPGARDFFTIDVAGQIVIGDITGMSIEIDQVEGGTEWRPEAITFSIDGRNVFERMFQTPPEVTHSLPLAFPN